MMRCAGCDEMIFEVVSVDFGWMLLILGSCARASHIQASPLERGGLDAVFLLVMSWLYIDVIFQSAAVNVFTATTRVDMLSSQ